LAGERCEIGCIENWTQKWIFQVRRCGRVKGVYGTEIVIGDITRCIFLSKSYLEMFTTHSKCHIQILILSLFPGHLAWNVSKLLFFHGFFSFELFNTNDTFLPGLSGSNLWVEFLFYYLFLSEGLWVVCEITLFFPFLLQSLNWTFCASVKSPRSIKSLNSSIGKSTMSSRFRGQSGGTRVSWKK